MKPYVWILAFTVLIVGAALGVRALLESGPVPAPAVNERDGEKISVVVSFYPLEDFVKNVGGDRVSVTNITPSGTEPHEYEPTPRELTGIYASDVFFYNGDGLDPWADKLVADLRARGVVVVRMSDHVDAMEAERLEEEEDEHADEEEFEESEFDPHFWLDPEYVIEEAKVITQTLAEADPDHAESFQSNLDIYISKLDELDREFENGLAVCETRTIVTTHNAFRYLARAYNLETQYILGLSPDEEPSPRRIAEAADLAKSRDIKYIFFETLVSPSVAETIASEIGAETLVLNPLEGLTRAELAAGEDYLSVMRNNLANLQTALACQKPDPS